MYTWKSYFVVQADYQHWANEALFTALARLKPEVLARDEGLPLCDIHHTLEHLCATTRLWFARLQGAPVPDGAGDQRHPLWRELQTALRHDIRHVQDWLEGRPDSFFEGEVRFVEGDGVPRTLWVRDVLAHLFTEHAHQRGLVAAVAVRLGAPSPEMTFASYRREMEKRLDEARHAAR